MTLPKIIAIDGPAASGKSTLAARLAKELDYLYFDTGVMYRAVTWLALQRAIDLQNEEAVVQLAEDALIDVRPPSQSDGRSFDVWVDDQDLTWKIRSPEVEAKVSIVSAYPGVRSALSAQQRRIGMRGQVVMVGRDIGTVVLPEADLKLYLEASLEERARRRFDERLERGETADLDEILSAMRRRDDIDSTCTVAPLRPADNAIIIISDRLNSDDVLSEALRLIKLAGEDGV